MQVRVGERVGHYVVLAPLGAGGMGEVYRARDEKLERDVALKILPAELATNAEALRRFEQEARAASALNHPNIITIYEISRTGELAWIAMELVDGEDLRTLLNREPLTVKSALRIAVKVAEGLAAAHERGIVHRDLKPENVMLSRDGFVKILDFGLAKQMRVLTADDSTLPHTAPGAVFGTVGYMSPEQTKGIEMEYRSDQFSFGTILYEMLTRVRPFDRASKPETMTAIIREEPRPPSELNELVPYDLDRIIDRCHAKQPRDRYGSTRDLAHDLREVRDNVTHPSHRSARPAPVEKRRRAPVMAMSIAVVLLSLGAVGVRMFNRSRDAARIRSVAVLPFRDLSGTAEGKLLADGISEMIATRLAGVQELRIASPFDGALVGENEDLRSAAKTMGVQALIRGSVQRSGGDVRVTYALVDAASGDTLASSSATRPATELFSLEDAIAEELLRKLGRAIPPRAPPSNAPLGADDQRRFVEVVGMLQQVKDVPSVDRAIITLESLLGNARDSGAVNALLARALLYKSSLARRPAFVEQAMIYASRGVTLSPDDAEAHVTLGEVRNASGRYKDAVVSFERALQLRRDHPEAISGLAESYEGMGRAADAEAMYKRALAARPDSTGTYMKYGSFCYMRGRYADAMAHFRRATELSPNLSHAFANLGAAQQALGHHDAALASYEKSIAIHRTAAGYSNLGTLQFSLGRYDDAERSYERAAELAPGDFVMWANLGDARRWSTTSRERAGEAYERAIAAGREALKVSPGNAYARAAVALCLARAGNSKEAEVEIRRALELDPTHVMVLYKAALIALLRGNQDSAVSWLEQAIKAGYPASELDRDPELSRLRTLPSFRSAIKSTA